MIKGLELLCVDCGYQGKPTPEMKGSFIIEILLLCCFILPGLIYTAWRLSTKKNVCPSCGSENLIPVESPGVQRILTDLGR